MMSPFPRVDRRPTGAVRRRLTLDRVRVQLVGALLLAVIVPGLVRAVYTADYTLPSPIQLTLIASALAAAVGYGFFRSLGTYPGIESGAYIVPCMVPTYGVAAIVLLFLKQDYSRLILFTSLVVCTLWLALVFFINQRRRHLIVALAPFGDVRIAESISGVVWQLLDQPTLTGRTVSAIAVDLDSDLPDDWDRFLADVVLGGTPVYDLRQLCESLTGRTQFDRPSENRFGALAPLSTYIRLRAVVERIVALLLLVMLMPLMLAVALWVRLDSPGPALFRQRRIGYRGRPFVVNKFRTMVARRPAATSPVEAAITLPGDPRITYAGRILRKSRLDELPQLINVVRGEMAFIGPRPEAVVLSEWYEREIPFYRYRHIVPPGITGWAQVNQGHVAYLDDVRMKLEFDFYYAKHLSISLDLIVVIRTIVTMFTGRGAH